MISDYLSTVPTLIAIINTVIAVASSHFKPEQTKWKFALLGASLVLGVAAAVTTIAGQHHVVAVQAERASLLGYERAQIGNFIEDADTLLLTLRDQSKPVPLDDLNKWYAVVEAWLNDRLGPSYVQRFNDNAGLVHGEPPNVDETHQGYWNGIYERVTRLQQFSSELSPATP